MDISKFDPKELIIKTSFRYVCIGTNPKKADIINPNGIIYEKQFFVVAETINKELYIHNHLFKTQEAVDKFVLQINNSIPTLTRFSNDCWDYARLKYETKLK